MELDDCLGRLRGWRGEGGAGELLKSAVSFECG